MNTQLTSEFSDRLVTLSDGRSGLRGALPVEVQAASPSSAEPSPHLQSPAGNSQPVLRFTASDETLDRYGEIISASGWRLDNYRRNPVFQNAHQYGDVIFTLGKAISTEVRDGRLSQTVEFATEVNPMARIAYGLYKGKFLNAVSVGFIPLKWVNGEAEGRGGFRRKYVEQELLEVSAVGIPANPNALALGLKSGAIEKADLQELREVIGRTLEQQRSVEGAVQTPARSAVNYPRLLELARELLHVLKHS